MLDLADLESFTMWKRVSYDVIDANVLKHK